MILSKPVGEYKFLVMHECWHPFYTPPQYGKKSFYACRTKMINNKEITQVLIDAWADLVWINVNPNNILFQ